MPLGVAAMAAGGVLILTCVGLFASRGRGTPAPFDPPREFVAVGPYRYVRNPMYVGALTLLVGFGLWQRSVSVLLFALLAALIAHLFLVLFEEPDLERRFGDSYVEYKGSVNRWLPRRPERAA
jgi:protein-S-isoprenylcysteine O-methyltransferase Ste14